MHNWLEDLPKNILVKSYSYWFNDFGKSEKFTDV